MPIKRDCSVTLDIPVLHTPADAIQSVALIIQAVMRGDISLDEGESYQK
ncbi:hypothetical protein [Candidatus Protochlamydia amoebophila]|nr:hypothetical protein [Candidatus Protochlamydia amoebophila]